MSARCSATKWVASGRIRGWGNEMPCSNKAVEDGLCRTHLKLDRRNRARCEACGADVTARMQFGGHSFRTSGTAWAWCECGHLTNYSHDNRIEISRAGLIS